MTTHGKALPVELLDRVPPHDSEAEQHVIGALILEPALIRDLAGSLRAEDFCLLKWRTLYTHLVAADAAGEAIDAVLLAKRLQASNELEKAGGYETLAACMHSVPVAAHAAHYAAIIVKKAQYRAAIQVATDLLRDGFTGTEEPEIIVARAVKGLQEDLSAGQAGEPVPIATAVVEACGRFDAICERKQSFGFSTGLLGFDEVHGGLFPGELSVIAARPALGKTSLGCQIALYFARSGRSVYFASAEMSAVELATRIICGQAGVNSRLVRTASIDQDSLKQLAVAAQPLGALYWWIDDYPRLTTARIRRCCRRLAQNELDLVVVDYLGRLAPEDSKLKRHEQIGQMARDLKSIARELSVPVLCLVQLNRQSVEDKRPRLHHLRDSGEIEQEADVVTFLHSPATPRLEGFEPSDPNITPTDWSIEKNRNGEIGRIELDFIRSRTMFECAGEGNSSWTQM